MKREDNTENLLNTKDSAQPVFQEHEAVPSTKVPYNGIFFNIVAIVFGVLSLGLGYYATVYALICGIVGVFCAFVDRIKVGEFRSLAHIGLLCGVLGVFFSVVFFLL